MNTNKQVTITYAEMEFTIDFSKRGIPSIYHNGKLLKPIHNKKLNRYHFSISLPKEMVGVVPGTHLSSNGYGAIWHEYRYRLVAAGKIAL